MGLLSYAGAGLSLGIWIYVYGSDPLFAIAGGSFGVGMYIWGALR